MCAAAVRRIVTVRSSRSLVDRAAGPSREGASNAHRRNNVRWPQAEETPLHPHTFLLSTFKEIPWLVTTDFKSMQRVIRWA